MPKSTHEPAIILEVKSSKYELNKDHINELIKNCKIAANKYKKWIGILFNGFDIYVYKNGERLFEEKKLQRKEHYLGLFEENRIDTKRIYAITQKINDLLHFQFGVNNLNERMIFTACALVAARYGAMLAAGMPFDLLKSSILSTLSKSYEDARNQNSKLDLLLEAYSKIRMNATNNQEAIDEFISCIKEIADDINSRYWHGEDVMAIFFNEFNRYKGKREHGQVFTPDHITSLMYRVLNVNQDDVILDATCGTGAFLVKCMCNMIKEAGGIDTAKANIIKQNQLYGIEYDPDVYALACANMLIHKDGKTNLKFGDSRTEEICDWIRKKSITKVLMNPPFEKKYGCMEIIANVLSSVPANTLCGFILPDSKLEKERSKANRILKANRLEKIIKLPTKLFSGAVTSIFVFRSGIPQMGKEIFSCYLSDDGYENVKNKGRHDIYNKWHDIENKWVEIIERQQGDSSIKWLNPNEQLAYKADNILTIDERDFKKTVLDYVLFLYNREFNNDYILTTHRKGDK